jgi:hypothetical protein
MRKELAVFRLSRPLLGMQAGSQAGRQAGSQAGRHPHNCGTSRESLDLYASDFGIQLHIGNGADYLRRIGDEIVCPTEGSSGLLRENVTVALESSGIPTKILYPLLLPQRLLHAHQSHDCFFCHFNDFDEYYQP